MPAAHWSHIRQLIRVQERLGTIFPLVRSAACVLERPISRWNLRGTDIGRGAAFIDRPGCDQPGGMRRRARGAADAANDITVKCSGPAGRVITSRVENAS